MALVAETVWHPLKHNAVRQNMKSIMKYDAFICHATEDKNEIVRPLAFSLIKRGYQIWYDESSLVLGASLRREIDEGLKKSRKGIIILSPAFFSKRWSAYELDGLLQLELNSDEMKIIPIWHNVSKKDVLNFSPTLADKFACSTEKGIEVVANAISKSLGVPLQDQRIANSNNLKSNTAEDICPKCGVVGGVFSFDDGYRWLECPACGHLEPLSHSYLDPRVIRFKQLRGSDDI